MPLHSDVEGVISHIEINLASFDTITRDLSKEQFTWSPEPGRWSIAQCLMHLNLINGADLPKIDSAIARARSQGLTAPGPFQYGWFSRKFVGTMELPVTRKFTAPKAYVPLPDIEMEKTL